MATSLPNISSMSIVSHQGNVSPSASPMQVQAAELSSGAVHNTSLPGPSKSPDPATMLPAANFSAATGRYTWDNGDIYEGQFLNGLMHGEGVYLYAKTGNKYQGQWFKGKKHGQGIFWNQKRREVYEGSWKDGARCGYGTMTNEKEV